MAEGTRVRSMSHAHYEVKWNPERKKWIVKEKRGTGYYVLDVYRRKEPAKKQARRLARKDNTTVAFYSKDVPGRERVTYDQDYSR